MLRRQLRHLAHAEDQDARLVERAEDVLRQFDRRIADGHGAPRDARLRAHALSRRNGAVKQRVQHRARRVAFECERVRLLDLREDLPLAEDERIKACRHAEEVADAFFVLVHVKVFFDVLVVSREVEEKAAHGLARVCIVRRHRVNLAAVARREHDRFKEIGILRQMLEPLADGVLRYGKPLAHIHGRRLMIQSQNNQVHVLSLPPPHPVCFLRQDSKYAPKEPRAKTPRVLHFPRCVPSLPRAVWRAF